MSNDTYDKNVRLILIAMGWSSVAFMVSFIAIIIYAIVK